MKYDYYVYMHRRKDSNDVFYIGKGRGDRAYSRACRNKWWRAIVEKADYDVEFVEKGMSEESAFDLEIELIKFYRECNTVLCNLTAGGEGKNGIPTTEEAKLKMAEQGTPVYCSNGMMFVSGRRAMAWLRANGHPKARESGIYRCCKGLAKIAYKLRWSYEDVFTLTR